MPENQPNWLAPLVYQKRAWNFYNVCHFNHPMSFCSRVIYYNHSLFWQRVFSFTDHPVSGNDCSNKQVMVLSLCDLCMPVFPSRCSVCVCVCVSFVCAWMPRCCLVFVTVTMSVFLSLVCWICGQVQWKDAFLCCTAYNLLQVNQKVK